MANRKELDFAAEQTLIDQCRRQDLDAFGKIVDSYQSRVLGFVRRMTATQEEAEDIAQEVFVRAYQNLQRFDGRSTLRTWLFRIAYNLCIDASRRKLRQPKEQGQSESAEEAAVDPADHRWNPESLILNDELRAVIDAAIGTMSEKLRTVLLLHDKEEIGYEDLASMLEIPIGTVKSRLFLARNHVQKEVTRYLNGEVSA